MARALFSTKVLLLFVFASCESAAFGATKASAQQLADAHDRTVCELSGQNAQVQRLYLACGLAGDADDFSKHAQGVVDQSDSLKWLGGIARLFDAIAWPIIALLALFLFRQEFIALFARVKEIKLGQNQLVLEASMHPAAVAADDAKASLEVDEFLRDENGAAVKSSPDRVMVRVNHLIAEDLALRALQTEYGVVIRRHVTGGADPGFDGAFVSDGRLSIVEVKYYKRTFRPDRLQQAISSITNAIRRYKWKNVQIILVAVFDVLDDASLKAARLARATSTSAVPVVVRVFSMGELKARFGIDDQDASNPTGGER